MSSTGQASTIEQTASSKTQTPTVDSQEKQSESSAEQNATATSPAPTATDASNNNAAATNAAAAAAQNPALAALQNPNLAFLSLIQQQQMLLSSSHFSLLNPLLAPLLFPNLVGGSMKPGGAAGFSLPGAAGGAAASNSPSTTKLPNASNLIPRQNESSGGSSSSSSSSASNSSNGANNSHTHNILFPPTRKWQVSFTKNLPADKVKLEGSDLNVAVTMKIRGEEPKSFVAEKLYSSHKYVMQHTIEGKLVTQHYPLLVSRLFVVDPLKPEEEILKNDKPIIKGSSEAAITKASDSSTSMKGTMKIQFTDVSYHHEKKYFAFKVNYYDPAKLDVPLFVLMSPPFRVYARKPTTTEVQQAEAAAQGIPAASVPTPKKSRARGSKGKEKQATTPSKRGTKRKASSSSTAAASPAAAEAAQSPEPVQPSSSNMTPQQHSSEAEDTTSSNASTPAPTGATTASSAAAAAAAVAIAIAASHEKDDSCEPAPKKLRSAAFQEYIKRLNDLVAIKGQLTEEDKKLASECSMEKLLAIDPEYAMDFFLKEHQAGANNFAFVNGAAAVAAAAAAAANNVMQPTLQLLDSSSSASSQNADAALTNYLHTSLTTSEAETEKATPDSEGAKSTSTSQSEAVATSLVLKQEN